MFKIYAKQYNADCLLHPLQSVKLVLLMFLKFLSSLLLTASVFAADISSLPVVNGDFENPYAPPDANTNADRGLPNWTVSGKNTYIINIANPEITITGVTGNQYIFFEPFYDGGDTFLQQNIGEKFKQGTYTLTVDIGYATGVYDTKKDASAKLQFWASDGNSEFPVGDPAVIGAEMLSGHSGNLVTYRLNLVTKSDSPWLGKDILVRVGAFDGEQNVAIDNVRADFKPEQGQ